MLGAKEQFDKWKGLTVERIGGLGEQLEEGRTGYSDVLERRAVRGD